MSGLDPLHVHKMRATQARVAQLRRSSWSSATYAAIYDEFLGSHGIVDVIDLLFYSQGKPFAGVGIMKLQGDVNFDGVVNAADMGLIASHWLTAGTGTADPAGDANHDGIVNAQDISIVAAQWLQTADTVRSSIAGTTAAVPEPTAIVAAVTGLLALALLRRRTGRGADALAVL